MKKFKISIATNLLNTHMSHVLLNFANGLNHAAIFIDGNIGESFSKVGE